MSHSEKNIDLIDKALKGILNHDEVLAYQNKLRNDPDFAALALDMELMKKAITINSHVARLQTLEKSLPPVTLEQDKEDRPDEYGKNNGYKGIQRLMSKWGAAASILLFLSVGSYFFLENKPGSEDLFTSNFQAYPDLETERNRNKAPAAAIAPEQSAYDAYNAKNYEAAIKAFLLFVDQKNVPKDYFFLGNAYLASNKPTEAIATFRKITDSPKISNTDSDADYKDRANWYLALACLKIGNTDLATSTLKLIAKNAVATSYKEKAARLLQELD